MFWTIKFWVRDHYQAWVAKRFEALPNCFHYWFIEKYLRERAKHGDASYFHALLKSYEEDAQ